MSDKQTVAVFEAKTNELLGETELETGFEVNTLIQITDEDIDYACRIVRIDSDEPIAKVWVIIESSSIAVYIVSARGPHSWLYD